MTEVKLYHRTTLEKACSILKSGFRDGTGNYLTAQRWTGVWLSDQPLDENEGANGSTLLSMRIPAGIIAPFEWVQDVGYREFLVPSKVVNKYLPPSVEEVDVYHPELQKHWRLVKDAS